MEGDELKRLLATADRIISYSPMGDEPDPGQFLREHTIVTRGMSLLPSREVPPHEVARPLVTRYSGERVCIFVPGRAFDRLGTRHGRGGGWYDRLLSLVPAHWTRIGVTFKDRLSETQLPRAKWDEPVDYVLVKGSGWDMMATNARHGTA
ncbi:MAG: 5-formyltetrahydrofolate cyclo-ligase [Patescibacteria group bacterium]